jgi:hypothetical protein
LAEFYYAVANLTFGILTVNPPEYFVKRGIDFYEEACKFSFYLTKAVESKRINWDHNIRHAWTQYLRLRSRDLYYDLPVVKSRTPSLDQMLDDLGESFLEDHESSLEDAEVESITLKDFLSKALKILSIYYPDNQVDRFMPLALLSIESGLKVPRRVEAFKNLFLAILKQMSHMNSESFPINPTSFDHPIDQSVVTLSVLMYLTSLDNCTIPLELASSLDLLSLTTLASVAGGKTLYIPTVRDLETLVTAAVAFTKMITEGSDSRTARRTAKNYLQYDHDIRFLIYPIQSMLKSLESSDCLLIKQLRIGPDGVERRLPLLASLVKNLSDISKCQSELLDLMMRKIENASTNELIEYLRDLDGSERKLISFLEKLVESGKLSDEGYSL